jgi:hypothetical protein
VTFKQVRESFLYLRGGWSTSALKSFPADVLILDEFDEMAGSAVALARRRLNASLVRREVDISTPSVPGFGIHRMFLDSDQHRYEQRHRCGAWVVYDFLRDVRVRGQAHDAWGEWAAEEIRRHPVVLHCPECGDAVSDEERLSEGRWEAMAPEVQGLRGYWVPPLAFPSVNLLRLAAAAVNPDPFERQQFFQSDLGLPYTVAGSKVTLDQILQLASPLENGALPKGRWIDPTMGVDIGFKKHYKVSATSATDQKRYTLAVGSVDEWADLDGLMRHFRIRRCIVDAQPDLDSAKEFAARWPGRVLRAFYPGPSALKGQLWHMDGLDLKKLRNRRLTGRLKVDVVTINRTMAMDRVRAIIVKLAEPAPTSVVNDPEFQAHLQSPTRTTMPDTRGQPVSVWLHSGPDHLMHACIYDMVARETLPAAVTAFATAVGGARTESGQPVPAPAGRLTAPVVRGPSRSQRVRSIIKQAHGDSIRRDYGNPDLPRAVSGTAHEGSFRGSALSAVLRPVRAFPPGWALLG